MGRIVLALGIVVTMSGCVIASAISGVAGAAVDGVFYLFQGTEESLSINMRATLVAVQRGLEKSGLHVNVLEPVKDGGYVIALGNENLDGLIALVKQTESLTTITVKVKINSMRQDSIERALVETIREQSKKVRRFDRFNFKGYRNIYVEQNVASKKIGWFLPGTPLDVTDIAKSDWMRIKMPSGGQGYLKGALAASTHK